MVGLIGAEDKLPGEISGGMRKRAGLARALVLDPEIILFDEPDSGLDPVRTAYLNQLIVDLNAAIEATFLIVTHDINTARTVPDNIGLLYHRHLAMFGPREMLLSSEEPVVRQFLNAQRQGPIGMAEEKDADELAQEEAEGHELPPLPPIPLQLPTSDGTARPTAARAGRLVPGERRHPAARVVRVAQRPPRAALPTAGAWPSLSLTNPAVGALRQSGNLFALGLDVAARAAAPAVPDQGVHPAGLVHRQRHDPADRAGLHPVRRGHRAAARQPDPPARRAVVHRARPACSP